MKRMLYLSDLYNYFVSQNKNVRFNSKDDDTTIVVHIDEPFSYSKVEDDDLNLYAPIRLCHTDENVNKSSISEEAMKDAMSTAYEMPVLGYIYPDPDNEEQLTFAGHEFYIDENGDTVYEESPIGVISNSQKLELVYDEKANKTYLDGVAKIWRTYTKAAEILEREKKFWCSVELCVDDLSYSAKDKLLIINAFRFSGVTILGKSRSDGSDIKPGMVGSNISISDFSEQNNSLFSQNEKVIKLLSELNEKLDGLNIDNQNSKEGGKDPVKKKFDEQTEEEIKDTPSMENFDDKPENGDGEDGNDINYYDDPENPDDDPSEDDPQDEPSGDTPSGDEPQDEPSGDEPSGDDPSGDDPSGDDDDDDDDDDTIVTSDDDAVTSKKKKKVDNSLSVTIDYGESSKTFSVSLQDKISALYQLVNDTYSEQDGVYYDCEIFDEDKYLIMSSWWSGDAYKQSYKVKKDVYSLVGDRVPVKAVWCTEDEQKALDNMRANYSAIESELASFKAEPEKEAILAKECYAQIADVDAFKELSKKENHFSMSVDEVSAEADRILLEYAKGNEIKFSAKDDMKLFGNPSKKKSTKANSRYGGLFSK